ncbi:hypothetical protein LCGC14_1518870 [marine sediment metagenome]|uniref:Uncharacterized protein n=1 Tax=marine sediment metagenome TaxID=412755 RepID=A0A0F9IZ75_9ZZZZ
MDDYKLKIGNIVFIQDRPGDSYHNLGQLIDGPDYRDPQNPMPMWKINLEGAKVIWAEEDVLEFMFQEPPPSPPVKYNRFTFLDWS